MDKHVINFFKKHNLILKNKIIVIAVSTGVDSMVLLHTLLILNKEYNLKIYVAHLNHRKREQSSEEEKFIKDFCAIHKIGCFTEVIEEAEYQNFQSYAREQRYAFFENVMNIVDGDYLLLAHHTVDNMETIIMRIIRGSNIKGYSGMDEISKHNTYLLLRPFLDILKEELIEYANLHKIKYYQDASNYENIYTRNRIRNDLIPLFFKEDDKVHLKFQEFSNNLKEAHLIIEEKVLGFISRTIKTSDNISFNQKDFLSLSQFMQTEVLFYLLKVYNLSKVNILEIIKLINSKKQNLKVIFKKVFTFVKEYDEIYIYYKVIKDYTDGFYLSLLHPNL